jgi:hypothetical protein
MGIVGSGRFVFMRCVAAVLAAGLVQGVAAYGAVPARAGDGVVAPTALLRTHVAS